MQIVSDLIADVESFISSNISEKQKNGDDFNLLKISGISWLEVKMCRILAEIIDPAGCHHQGYIFLKNFVNQVLNINMSDNELSTATVYTEYLIDSDRRIDIVISTINHFIPIEVKIYAKDQKNQCYDYYKYANDNKSKNKNDNKVYYLTLDGHLPVESTGLTPILDNEDIVGYKEIFPISFCNDVTDWLENIAEEVCDKSMLNNSIIQFKNAIESLGGKMNNDIIDKVSNLISQSREKFQSAIAISEAVDVSKRDMLIKVFERLENAINESKYPLIQLNNKFYYKFNDAYSVNNYYKKKTSPMLVYKYKILNENKEIWFMIELTDFGGLDCGFVVAENGNNPGYISVSDDEIMRCFKKTIVLNKFEWWLYWNYIPVHIDDTLPDSLPNFKDLNEKYFELYDEDKFEMYIKKCIFKIISILHNSLLPEEV